jgi:hypothetical protein
VNLAAADATMVLFQPVVPRPLAGHQRHPERPRRLHQALYMPILIAIRFNPDLNRAGQPHKRPLIKIV